MLQFNEYSNRQSEFSCKGVIHVVKAGDTLYKIAKQYDIKLFDLMKWNPYVNIYNLQVGDEICIPTVPSLPVKTYVVNEGDTIGKVLQALQVDWDTLLKHNSTLYDIELPVGLVLSISQMNPDLIRESVD